MVTSIYSAEPKNRTITKTTIGAAAGAGIGAGTAYLLQSRAIKKEKEAQEAAKNKTWITKTFDKIKDFGKSIKNKCTDTLSKVAKEGKISKMGIAKAAGAGAVIIGGATYLKTKLPSSKKNN